jgi:hypothetical protein
MYGRQEKCVCVLVERHEIKNHLEDLGVDGRIKLKWIFKKWDSGGAWNGSDSGQGQVARSCECGNESSGSVKCGELLK